MTRRNFLAGAGALLAVPNLRAEAPGVPGSITVVHCGDPQFGFSPSLKGEVAYRAGLAAFERVVEAVNDLRPDLVCISGDMVHDWRELPRDWPRLMKAMRPKCIVTAGNHDIPDAGSREQRMQFESVFGAACSAMTVKGWRIISLNGQFERSAAPDPAYVAWRNAELDALVKSGAPGIVLTHQPLFLSALHEPDGGENYPQKSRKALFDKMADAGVKYVLAGHTHRILTNAYRGIPELMAETTCNNFDGRPFGFRVLKADASGNYSWDFVKIGS